jgi:hypothetical protein
MQFPRTPGIRILIALLATAAAGCVAPDGAQRADLPIASARQLAKAAQVTVEGVVTVGSGTFDDGFALQDASAGIYVTRARGIAVAIGERVRVSGRIVAPNNQAGIEAAAIVRLGAGGTPAPAEVKTGAVGAATEGRLIAVRGKAAGNVIDDPPWGWKVFIDDGSGPLLVFIATTTEIDVHPLRAGQQLRVVGFSGRYEQHTELLPRRQADLEILSN